MGLSPRVRFIGSAVFIITALAAVIIGLTLGLRTPPLPNGGSPEGPPTEAPPTEAPPTEAPPTEAPPTEAPPTEAPPTKAPPTEASPTEAPPTEAPPTEAVATDAPPTEASISETQSGWSSESGNYRFAAAVSETHVCSKLGSQMLRRLGSAMDAAVAMAICVGVVNPHSSGIGGGHFTTVYMPRKGSLTKEIRSILAREVAPQAATEDMFVNKTDASIIGGLSIGVPGDVAGLYEAWQEYGHLEWEDLIQPTIDLLEKGYSVEKELAKALVSKEEQIRATPNLRGVYVKNDGSLMREGDTLKDPLLANTLSRIAKDPMEFYQGGLAKEIIADIQEAGGIVTLDDLSNYTVRHQEPIAGRIDSLGLTVYGPRPPSSGVILQYILRLFDGFKDRDINTPDAAILSYHRMVEVFKFAYAKRSALGDEMFVNVTQILADLTSSEYIDSVRARVTDDRTHNVSYYGPAFEVSDHGTGSICVLAGDGSAVSMTTTINFRFGSFVRGTRTGILFNDEMDDFSSPHTVNNEEVPPSPTNYIKPGKMPMSSMAPTIILNEDGDVVYVTGGTGGPRITTALAFVTLHNLYFQKDLKEATDTQRLHHQLVPNIISYEPNFPADIRDGLEQKGHSMSPREHLAVIGSIKNICTTNCTGSECFDRKCLCAVADGRKGGAPDGF